MRTKPIKSRSCSLPHGETRAAEQYRRERHRGEQHRREQHRGERHRREQHRREQYRGEITLQRYLLVVRMA